MSAARLANEPPALPNPATPVRVLVEEDDGVLLDDGDLAYLGRVFEILADDLATLRRCAQRQVPAPLWPCNGISRQVAALCERLGIEPPRGCAP